MRENDVLTVSQLNRYVKSILDGDRLLKDVYLKGELSNFTNHYRSGHFYFTLKEGGSAVKAVMFSRYSSQLLFEPENGMSVIVRCSVSLYEKDGTYQIYIYDMQPDGVGSLHLAYQQLLMRLQEEGLFSEEYKKPIPAYPRKIGIVTSDTGAALQDMLQILSRRYPLAKVCFHPALVQGENAPFSIIEGLYCLENLEEPCDVIIVGRGGGSLEDLWAFNNEQLARTIFSAQTPIVSAVGHETDFTICDFVADMRAATPSAAIEMITPNIDDLQYTVEALWMNIEKSMERKLKNCKSKLLSVFSEKEVQSLKGITDKNRQNLNFLIKSIHTNIYTFLRTKNEKLAMLAGQIDSMSPMGILRRGYTITQSENNKPITHLSQVTVGDILYTKTADGKIISQVLKTQEDISNG